MTHAEDVTGELGFIYLRMGRLDEALVVLEEAVGFITRNHMSGLNATRPLDALALAYLMAVERASTEEKKKCLEKARHACRDALRHGRVDRAGYVCALRFRARFEWLRGRPRAARRFWRKGLAAASRLGAVYETGMIELEMGERLRDARLVKEAETILDKAGAIIDRDAAGRVLQNLVGTLPECGENGVQPRRADH